jgi:virginiamycin B lyase
MYCNYKPVLYLTLLGVVAMTSVCSSLIAARADAAVYWGDHILLGAVNLDGSGADSAYFNPLSYPQIAGDAACGVAVNSQYLYWLGLSQIDRVNLDGPTVPGPVLSGLSGACDLTVSESHLYWAHAEAGTIGRANVDGTEANDAFIRGVDRPCGIAIDEHHIYWAGKVGIGRANLEGGEVEPAFIPGFFFCGVTVTDHYLFWSGYSGTIGRANIDGSEVNSNFINGTAAGDEPYLAADATHVYWTNSYSGGQTLSTIGRANVDGTEVNQSWITTDRRDELTGIAVDSRLGLSVLPLPSQPIQFGKVWHNRRTGVIVVNVQAWEGDQLSVMSPEINWKVQKSKSPSLAGTPVSWRLKLWPGKFRGIARRIHTQLRRTGRATIDLRLVYYEPGKTVLLKRKHLTFLRARSRRKRALAGHSARKPPVRTIQRECCFSSWGIWPGIPGSAAGSSAWW